MLRWKRVEISAGALLLGAALYYLDEQGVLLMAFCACALHELGHWLVIRALGGRVTALRITCVGAEMRLSARCPLGYWPGGQSAGRPDGGRAWDGGGVLLCWAQSGAGRIQSAARCPTGRRAHPLVYPGAADLGGTGRTAAAGALLRAGSGAGSRSAAAALAGEGKPHSAHYRALAAGAACSQTMPRDTDGMKILLAIR